MYQVIQNVSDGQLTLADITPPTVQANQVLIANRASLVSAGTEKMVMEFANKSLMAKARERPDQVKRVIEKMQTEGVRETLRQVKEKLDEPIGLGYSSAGTVVACGDQVQDFQVGDRVASNGPHASMVAVPENLTVRVPDNISFQHASFGVLGSIAMQGVRLSKCTLGETVFIIGLGLVGQLTISMLRAAGCRVIGTDPDQSKCDLAIQSGAEIASPNISASKISELTGGAGTDAVIITASTQSNGPIDLACEAVRQKGRIVLVGVVGLEIPRRPMYFKEAEFVVSCSYGPGRYDSNYEERGIDYPLAHVRWTQRRNIQSVLDLMGREQISVDHLISHTFGITEAVEAYDVIKQNNEPYLGIILEYPDQNETRVDASVSLSASTNVSRAPKLAAAPSANTPDTPPRKLGVGILGVGNFARMTMLPAIKKTEAFVGQTLCSAGGLSATHAKNKFAYKSATSAENEVFESDDIDAIFILTRHDLHSRQVIQGLNSNKHVLVEKPLAVTETELEKIGQAVQKNPKQVLTVGFNRRFSAAASIAKKHLAAIDAPLTVQYRFNAGAIPADHWVQHPTEGGGRIIGEACHAIDLVTYLTGSLPIEVHAVSIGGKMAPQVRDDQCFISLKHANGSISSIAYLAGGDRSLPKERIEVLGGGRACVINDFKEVDCYSGGKHKRTKFKTGKGHYEEVVAFSEGIASGIWPISWDEIESTTRCAIAAVKSLRIGSPVVLKQAGTVRRAAA